MQFHPKLAMAIHAGFYIIQNLSTFMILIHTGKCKRDISTSIVYIYVLELFMCNLEVFVIFQFALLKENSIQYIRAIHLAVCFSIYQILLYTKILGVLFHDNMQIFWILFIFPSLFHFFELFFANRFKKLMILIFSKRYKEILLNPRVLNANIYREKLYEVGNIALLLSLILFHRLYNTMFLNVSPTEYQYLTDSDIQIADILSYSYINSAILLFNIIILIVIAFILGICLDQESIAQRISVLILMVLGFVFMIFMAFINSSYFYIFVGLVLYTYIVLYYIYGAIMVWRDIRNLNSGLKEVLENLKKNKSISKKI